MKTKHAARDVAVVGVASALMIGCQVGLSFLPNIELVLVIVLGAFYSLNPSALSAAFSALLYGISVFARMDNAYFGVLDLQAIVYFLSVAALFVFFTVQSIEKRRWS